MDALTSIGKPAPDFELYDLQGALHRLSERERFPLILNFWSAECPWSERADQELHDLLFRWQDRLKLWAIASNVNETPEQIRLVAAARKLPVVLIDSHHEVADQYGATTTPHLYLIDQAGKLFYQGALDDITFRKRSATRHYLQEAVDALFSGRQPEVAETRPYGCTIVRYKPE